MTRTHLGSEIPIIGSSADGLLNQPVLGSDDIMPVRPRQSNYEQCTHYWTPGGEDQDPLIFFQRDVKQSRANRNRE